MRTICLMWLLFVAIPIAAADEPELVDLTEIPRKIVREPKYAHEPHYALIVFGPEAAHRSWLVMDGDDMPGELSYVMFEDRDNRIGLNEALTALRARGLKVKKVDEGSQSELVIELENQPTFAIALNRKPDVAATAAALGSKTSFEKVLERCTAQFEVSVLSVKQALSEMETISTIHDALQEATQGIVYTFQDKQLAGPK